MPTIILKSPEGDPITLQDIYRVLLQGTNGAVPFGYIQTNKSATISSESGTITPDSGYGGMDEVSYTVASGSVTIPNTPITANLSISVNSATGEITATVSGRETITPTVSAGYVSSVSSAEASVTDSSTLRLNTLSANFYDPTSLDQTISSDQYLTGSQTIRGVTYTMTDGGATSTLDASVIKKDVVINIGTLNDADSVVSITGQYAGQTIDVDSVTATPSLTSQIILPSSYSLDYFDEVDVEAIPVTRTYDSATGGYTVAIAT